MRSWSSKVLLLALASLVAAPASAQECVTCWSKKCPDLKSYLKPCGGAARPKGKPAPAPEKATSAPPPVSVDALTARSTAETFLASGRLDEALTFADEAVKQGPTWPDAYLFRSRVRLARAGPDSELAALEKPDLTHDYRPMIADLTAAKADLEAYFKLAPQATDRETTIQSIGNLRARIFAAQAAQKAVEDHAKDVELGRLEEEARARQLAEAARQRQADEAKRQEALLQQQQAEARRVAAAEEARRAEQERQAAEAARQRALAERQAAEARQAESATSNRHAGYALTAIGVVAGGGAYALKSASDSAYQDVRTKPALTLADLQSNKKSGDTLRTLALVSAVTGGTLVAIGVPLILANLPAAQPSVAVAPVPGGAVLALGGRF